MDDAAVRQRAAWRAQPVWTGEICFFAVDILCALPRGFLLSLQRIALHRVPLCRCTGIHGWGHRAGFVLPAKYLQHRCAPLGGQRGISCRSSSLGARQILTRPQVHRGSDTGMPDEEMISWLTLSDSKSHPVQRICAPHRMDKKAQGVPVHGQRCGVLPEIMAAIFVQKLPLYTRVAG